MAVADNKLTIEDLWGHKHISDASVVFEFEPKVYNIWQHKKLDASVQFPHQCGI